MSYHRRAQRVSTSFRAGSPIVLTFQGLIGQGFDGFAALRRLKETNPPSAIAKVANELESAAGDKTFTQAAIYASLGVTPEASCGAVAIEPQRDRYQQHHFLHQQM